MVRPLNESELTGVPPDPEQVSVVLIAKNEERNIARLIESVLRETLGKAQVVLVDSESSDRTLEIASAYPIDLIRIRSDPSIRLCAAAGRFVGTSFTDRDLVLFLDGDHELEPGWLDLALGLMAGHRDIGVIGGRRVDLPPHAESPAGRSRSVPASTGFRDDVHAGSATLYRRSVLDEVGTFLPFLVSDEEPELALRIRTAGYRVVRTDLPAGVHFTEPEETFHAMFARRRRGLYLGFGQNLRYHARDGLLLPYLRARGFAIPVAADLAVGLGAAGWLVGTGDPRPLLAWLVVNMTGLGLLAFRRRSVRGAFHSVVHRVFILEGAIRGLWLAPLDPADYLRHAERVDTRPR